MQFELHAPLSRAECLERLNRTVDPGMNQWWGTNPVMGTIVYDRISLTKRHAYRNVFKTVLVAGLSDEGSGTRLQCRLGFPALVIAFLAVWLGIASIASAVGLVAAIQKGDASQLPGILLLPLIGAVVAMFSWRLARGDGRYLVEFLC